MPFIAIRLPPEYVTTRRFSGDSAHDCGQPFDTNELRCPGGVGQILNTSPEKSAAIPFCT
jgi:hypothetical protein